MKRILFAVSLLVLGAAVLSYAGDGSEDDSNRIFQSPPPDVPAPPTGPGDTAQAPAAKSIDQVAGQGAVQLSLSYHAYAGYSGGWSGIPTFSDLGIGWASSPIFGISSTLGFDGRPDPTFRMHGSMYWSFPAYATPYNYTNVSVPTIWEAFCDYSLVDAVFFRVGKQILNWGVSRFFPIDNLVARVPLQFQPFSQESFDNTAGIGVKIGIPIGIHSLTAVAQLKNGYIADPTHPHFGEVGYGLMGDLQLGKTQVSLGGYYEMYLTPRGLLTVQRSVFGIDLRMEAIVALTPSQSVVSSWLANIYWEQADAKFHVMAEYMYNAESSLGYINDSEPGYPSGHAIAVLAGFKEIFRTRFDVGVKWEHSFVDNSGIVTPAIQFKALAHATFTIGIPLYYGPLTGEMTIVNPDPLKRATSFGIMLDISGSI
jgi:hypothetical protein